MKSVRLTIIGLVQGVGYRDWTISTARRLGVDGWVRNRFDGSVEALVSGEDGAVESMIAACRRGPPLAEVDTIDILPAEPAAAGSGYVRRPTG